MQEQIQKLLQLHPDKKIHNYSFSMQALIGRGAYGLVYAGRIIDTGQPVALKVIPLSQMSPESFLLLQKEIDIMKDLDSLNVVKLIDVVRTGNNYYLVSELCTCGDLKEYMKKTGPIDESTALQTLTQILRGILQSFKRGIIHRDLKPANILLTEHQGQQLFKIADFGFAKRFDHLENDLMTSLVGTPLYMSPQVLLRRQYSAKCDVWSIGLIYFELIEGRTPWNVRDILDLVNKQRCTKINFSKKVSALSQQFIMGCLQYEENKRYSWENIFTHKLFEGVFEKQHIDQNIKVDQCQFLQNVQSQTLKTPVSNNIKQIKLTNQKSASPKNLKVVAHKGQSIYKPVVASSEQQTIIKNASLINPTSPFQRTNDDRYQNKNFKSENTLEGQSSPKNELKYLIKQTNYVALPGQVKKDRTISVASKPTDSNVSASELCSMPNSEMKTTYLTNNNQQRNISSNNNHKSDKSLSNNKSFHKQTEQCKKENFNNSQQIQVKDKKPNSNIFISPPLTQYNFQSQNNEIIQSHLDYLYVLNQLKDQLRELFHSQMKYSPVIAKLGFVLAKHAMIKSNEVKVQMIDKGINCLDLNNFEEYKKGEKYQSFEKPIVEHHFEIFGQYHQNFLEINEVLSLVLGDHDFQEIFNNFFTPTLQFAGLAHQLSAQLVQEHLKDLIYDSISPTLQSFSNAILNYSLHMRNHQFYQSERMQFLNLLSMNNPQFFGKYEQNNVENIRRINIQMLDTMRMNQLRI